MSQVNVYKEFGKVFVRFSGFEKIEKSEKLRVCAADDFRNGQGYRFRDSFCWDSLVAVVERKSDEGYQLVFVFPALQIFAPSSALKTEVELKAYRQMFDAKIKVVMTEKEIAVDADGVGELEVNDDE